MLLMTGRGGWRVDMLGALGSCPGCSRPVRLGKAKNTEKAQLLRLPYSSAKMT